MGEPEVTIGPGQAHWQKVGWAALDFAAGGRVYLGDGKVLLVALPVEVAVGLIKGHWVGEAEPEVAVVEGEATGRYWGRDGPDDLACLGINGKELALLLGGNP